MAFITVSPMSGRGNSTLTVTAAKHTGRSTRTSSFTVKCANDETAKATVTVNQSAASANINSVNSSPAASQNTAIPVTYSFKCNAASFYLFLYNRISKVETAMKNFDTAVDNFTVKINETTVALSSGVDGTTGKKFTTSLGTDAEYTVTVTFTIRASVTGYTDISWQVGSALTDTAVSSEQHRSNTYTSSKAKATLTVTPTSTPAIAAGGGSSSVSVATNDDWTVTVS